MARQVPVFGWLFLPDITTDHEPDLDFDGASGVLEKVVDGFALPLAVSLAKFCQMNRDMTESAAVVHFLKKCADPTSFRAPFVAESRPLDPDPDGAKTPRNREPADWTKGQGRTSAIVPAAEAELCATVKHWRSLRVYEAAYLQQCCVR